MIEVGRKYRESLKKADELLNKDAIDAEEMYALFDDPKLDTYFDSIEFGELIIKDPELNDPFKFKFNSDFYKVQAKIVQEHLRLHLISQVQIKKFKKKLFNRTLETIEPNNIEERCILLQCEVAEEALKMLEQEERNF